MQENFEERVRQRKAKEKKGLQIAFGAAAAILVMTVVYCGYLVFSDSLWFSKLQNSTKQADESSSFSQQLNIVVMGVDKRDDDVGRSDTLFLLSIDPKTHKVFQLSIPRDTRVRIPGYGWDKINHAYAYGGKDLTVATVEDFLGVKVHHAVEIDFQGFYRIVDAIGGVDIDVEKRMYYEDPWDEDGGLVIDLQPGMQHMDGKTAITYVRYRDEEGDIGRIERQQKFMRAVIEKVSSPGIITRLPAIISEVSSAVETDLSTLELLNLGRFFKESKDQGLQTNMGMVPGGGYYIQGISYWIPNMDELLSSIDEFDGMEPTPQWQRWAEKQKNLYWDALPAFDDESSGYYAEEDSLPKKEDPDKEKDKEEDETDKSDKDKSKTSTPAKEKPKTGSDDTTSTKKPGTTGTVKPGTTGTTKPGNSSSPSTGTSRPPAPRN